MKKLTPPQTDIVNAILTITLSTDNIPVYHLLLCLKKSRNDSAGCSRTIACSHPNLYPCPAAAYANQKSSATHAVSQVTLFSTAPLMRIQEPCIQPRRGRRKKRTGSWKRPKSSAMRMISAQERKALVQWCLSL